MVSPTTAPTPDTGPDTSRTPRVAVAAPTPGALTIFLPHAPHSSFPPASLPSHQGNGSTKLDKALLADTDGERYYGLENFGNTCYANSVLQALYFCKPFRHAILEYHESLPKDHDESLLTALGDLFSSISNQKKRTGVFSPKRFIERLKKDNVIFNSYMHQDAHEFFNFVVNECCEVLVSSTERNTRRRRVNPRSR